MSRSDVENAAATAPAARPRARWRWLRRLVVGLMVLVLVAVALLAWLLHSESGARFALGRVTTMLAPALTIEQLDGTLAGGLQLAGVRYAADAAEVVLDRGSVRVALAALARREVRVEHLQLGELTVTLPPREAAAEPAPLTLPDIELPVDIVVGRLDIAKLTVINGEQAIALGAVALEAALRSNRLAIATLEIGPQQWRVAARGDLTPADDWPLSVTVDWRLPSQPWRGRATLGGTLAELELAHTLSGEGLGVTTNGRAQVLNRVIPGFDVEHRCVSPCVVGSVTLGDARVAQRGSADDYALEASLMLDVAPLTPTQVTLTGTGSTQRLNVTALNADGASLVLRSSGAVAWSPLLDYRLGGTLSRLDAALLQDTLQGRIRAEFDLSGSGTADTVATLRNVSGTLNGYALAASARVQRSGTDIVGDALRVSLGDNRLAGFIRWQQRKLGADLTLSAPALEQVLPELSGTLSGTLSADGALDALHLETRLDGTALAWRDTRVERVALSVSTSGGQTAQGRIEVTGVATATQDLGGALIEFNGPLNDLPVNATVATLGQTLTLDARLSIAPNDVHGTVVQGVVDVDNLGQWRTAGSFGFGWTPVALSIDAQRWEAGDASLQLAPLTVAGDALELGATLTSMPLAPLNPFLPRNIRVGGNVNATMALTREGQQWRGNIDWQQQGTMLSARADGATIDVQFPVVQIQGQLEGPEGRVTLTLEGDYDTSGSGEFALRNDGGVTRVAGEAALNIRKLNWLGPFLPGVQKLAGALELEVSADGELSEPGLRGRVALRDAAATVPLLGVRLEDINLAGSGDAGGTIELRGGATSAGGRLDIDGRVEQALTAQRNISLHVRGEDIQVIDQQDYKLWMSPDLTLTIAEEGARVSGSIAVPRADVTVRQLPESAVSRSSDVTVVGRDTQERSATPVTGQIAVSVGDEVRFAAFGLTSEVIGDVELTLAEGRPPRLEGRLSLVNGQFAAYGQQLEVTKGDLIYAGAIDNPTLDVIATRRIVGTDSGDVLAGVRVSGPSRNPDIEVYSVPDMPQTDALSYLVLGRASLEGDAGNGALLSRAALGLGLSGSRTLAAGLAGGLGLDELTVRGGDTLDATELVAGKQLTDRLYVRYAFGVFSDLGTLLLHYRLSDRFSLEAGAAASQSLDLLYSIEK